MPNLLRINLNYIMKLNKVKDNGNYKVLRMQESEKSITRLMDMGLLPGETIRVRHEAPLGDPISIEFRDSHVSLRLKDAEKLEVESLND